MAKIAKLVVIKGQAQGLSCDISQGEEISIGRNLSCSLPVPDIKLSRIHCIVRHVQEKFEILDNNSTNGTYLNGIPVDVSTSLCANDIIQIGDSEIQFCCGEKK
jgi:pSer/pThr/pTyr-binding forkhead associated (FHA) protein